jgi:hypothetical protein
MGKSGLPEALSVFAQVHYVIFIQEKYSYKVFNISNSLLVYVNFSSQIQLSDLTQTPSAIFSLISTLT